MKFLLGTVFILWSLLGCSSRGPILGNTSEWRFPTGKYRQAIHLTLPGRNQEHEFSGWMVRTTESVKIVGLSPFGSTLFKVLHEGKGTEIEVFEERIKKHRKAMEHLFVELMPILLSKIGQTPKGYQKRSSESEILFESKDKKIQVVLPAVPRKAIQKNKDPYQTKIQHRAGWEVRIETLSFVPQ